MGRLFSWSKAPAFVAAAVIASIVHVAAQTRTESLVTVNIPRAVLADGKPLAAGTYNVRLSSDAPASPQTADGSRWVEFVQNDQVMGRELTSVVASADAASVLKGPGPASGTAKVELLKGNEYVRIWINRNGTHYLIHLPVK